MENSEKLSFYGRALRFYRKFGKFVLKVTGILSLTLLVSLMLVLYMPQFSIHKVGFEISHNILLAIAQVVVGITLLASMAVTVIFEIPAGLILLCEIPIEVSLKRRIIRLIKEKQKMSLVELVDATGVTENDLSFLFKMWIVRPAANTADIEQANQTMGKIKRGHLHFDVDANELSWEG